MSIVIRHEGSPEVYGKAASRLGEFKQKEKLRGESREERLIKEDQDFKRKMAILDFNNQIALLREKNNLDNNQNKFGYISSPETIGGGPISYDPTGNIPQNLKYPEQYPHLFNRGKGPNPNNTIPRYGSR